MAEIYSKFNWYHECTKPERIWKGILRQEPRQVGPNTRTSLGYSLVTEDTKLPVYSANVEQRLAQFADLPVLVYGKLVDLSGEGFEQEVWIGSIEQIKEKDDKNL